MRNSAASPPEPNRPITRQQAAAELVRRIDARNRFIDFIHYVDPMYRADPFHRMVASTLDKVISGEIKRLILLAPPQHGKSKLVTELFPAYWLARRSSDPVVIASYSADLAHTKSRAARSIVESTEYRALFGDLGAHSVEPQINPISTSEYSRAADEWRLIYPYRGGVRAAGVGGGLTGYPSSLAIIDDPVAGLKEARSETVRETTWDWYRSVLRTRVWENGAIVLIMTRWDEDDLAGRLIALPDNEWVVMRFPALAETQRERDANNKLLGLPMGLPDPLERDPGEPLAPSRFSRQALLDIQRDAGSLIWSALYAGSPRKADGNYFKRQWFPIRDASPVEGKRIRYWDKAGTESRDGGQGGAATAGLLLLKTPDNRYFIESVVRGWYSAYEREKVIKQTAETDAIRFDSKTAVTIYIEKEPGSGGKESAESTIRNLSGFVVKADSPTGDKDTRLEPFAAQCEAGNVFLVRGNWNEDYIEEMISIPGGKRRDQGDASSGAFNMLNASGGSTPRVIGYTGLASRRDSSRRR